MKKTSLWMMAWRNLGRNRRRTLLTLASIAFGVFLAIFSMAAQDRNWQDMIDLGARMGGGHVTVQHPEYLDTPSLSRTVTGTDALIAAAAGDDEVERAVERISGQLMVSTARESYGASFIAFDPDAEDATTLSYLEAVSEGEMFAADDATGVVLGAQLARNLGAELGDRVVYTATDRNGDIVAGLGRVRGILRTGAPSIDVGMVLLPIEAVRDVLGFAPDEATQVALFIADHRRSEALADRLQEQLGGEAAAVPWFEGRPDLYAFIAMKVGGGVIMIGVIALMVAAGIFNTVFVSVMERLREFGIMMAVGFSPAKLFRLVVYESVWLGVIGLVLAGMLTIGPYLYLNQVGIDMGTMLGDNTTEISGVAMATQLRFGIYPENAVRIVALAFVAVVLAGIYPAWRAGRVEPVESIRLG
ncbi:MAG: ABC transporter permease [Gemmatimonadetes bacterium]|nr:ABC transporter permease [Gemmatimonadota bacterium]